NACYQAGDYGRARLHWERALALNPSHHHAAANRDQLLARMELPAEDSTTLQRLASRISHSQWIWILSGGVWIALFSVLGLYWTSATTYRISFSLGLLAFLSAAVAL